MMPSRNYDNADYIIYSATTIGLIMHSRRFAMLFHNAKSGEVSCIIEIGYIVSQWYGHSSHKVVKEIRIPILVVAGLHILLRK